jgi:hypothetical protein
MSRVPKRNRKRKKILGESNKGVFKKVKEGGGKALFDGPEKKERKGFAPPSKAHQPKKGKNSYKRKKVEDEDEEKSCWKGYKKDGTKKKGGKTVNNCVKESKSIVMFIDALMNEDNAKAHKYLQDAINIKLRNRIEKEINTPLFTK